MAVNRLTFWPRDADKALRNDVECSEPPMSLSETQPTPPPPPDATSLRLLIVDDEPMLRSVIQDFLLMLGFEHQFVAGDGEEALEVLRREPIDLMLSDMRMPKMELEELLAVVQQELPNLTVIATSGYSDLENARNVFLKGAHDFLGKPLNLDALELSINWIVERQRVLELARELFGGEGALAPDSPDIELRLEQLAGQICTSLRQFQGKMEHARRMERLLRELKLDDVSPGGRVKLRLATLLHELGAGYQIQALCRQPRRLEDEELRLVQENAPITGRLVRRVLGHGDLETIIGRHLCWQAVDPARQDELNEPAYLALWLGVLNTLDGLVNDRPDRPAIALTAAREMLAQRHARQPYRPIRLLLEQWRVVEAYYAPGC